MQPCHGVDMGQIGNMTRPYGRIKRCTIGYLDNVECIVTIQSKDCKEVLVRILLSIVHIQVFIPIPLWRKLLQNETSSQKWLPNGLNEAEMREMEEILGPESNLEGLKMRLPIGRESKIKAYDWWRADDFKNSSHRPFVQKSLSFNLFWHHSGVFGVIPGTKSHFAVIGSIMEWLRYDSFTSFWNHGNEAQIGEWGNERNYCKVRLLLRNQSKMAWIRLKWKRF